MDVVALALSEGLVHLAAWNVDRPGGRVVETAAVAGVLEHRERLAAVIDKNLRGFQLVPREGRIGPARREEEAVLLVDLREVHRRRRLTLLERPEALGRRRLANVHGAVQQAVDRGLTRRRDGMRGSQPFRLEKPAGERGDQRRVESREAGELDTDLVAQWTLPGSDDSNIGPMTRAALVLLALGVGAAVLGACTVGGLQGPTLATTSPAGAPEYIPIEIQKPDGAGPFSAIVIMHDCSGLGPRSSGAPGRWARELVGRGYVVMLPDSFTTRGFPGGVCTNPSPRRADVGPSRRVSDAYAALAHLRTLPFVVGSHVGLIGGSRRSETTLATMATTPSASPGFKAAVALYPGCAPWLRSGDAYRPAGPLLILIGEKDDWTPAEPCRQLTEAAQKAGAPMTIKIYPGAYHSFDSANQVRFVEARVNASSPTGRGATTGGDPEAWADSIREVVAFFGRNLN